MARIIRKCNVFRIIAFVVPIAAVGTDAGHGRGRQYSKLIGVAVLQKTAPQKSIPSVCNRYAQDGSWKLARARGRRAGELGHSKGGSSSDSLVPMGPSGRYHPGTGCREPESTVLDETGLPRPCSSTALVCAASATSSHAARWSRASRAAANARGTRAVDRMDWSDAWDVVERPDTSPAARSCCRGGATGSPDRARRRPPRP